MFLIPSLALDPNPAAQKVWFCYRKPRFFNLLVDSFIKMALFLKKVWFCSSFLAFGTVFVDSFIKMALFLQKYGFV